MFQTNMSVKESLVGLHFAVHFSKEANTSWSLVAMGESTSDRY